MTENRLSNALLPFLNKKPRDTSELGNIVSRQSHSIGAGDGGNLAMLQRIDQQSNPCRPDPHAVFPSRHPRPEKWARETGLARGDWMVEVNGKPAKALIKGPFESMIDARLSTSVYLAKARGVAHAVK